ncbi:hypothetical protein [Agarilytica rhodophyticola]|nr:hypothetical protein [Agarilytica rhodophyticola]
MDILEKLKVLFDYDAIATVFVTLFFIFVFAVVIQGAKIPST